MTLVKIYNITGASNISKRHFYHTFLPLLRRQTLQISGRLCKYQDSFGGKVCIRGNSLLSLVSILLYARLRVVTV